MGTGKKATFPRPQFEKGGFIMMYPFMTLNDDTEITHSEMKPDGKVKVYIETRQNLSRGLSAKVTNNLTYYI